MTGSQTTPAESKIVIAIIGVLAMIVAGCNGGSSGGPSKDTPHSNQPAVPVVKGNNLAACQKKVGTYVFQVRHQPFNAAYRNGIDQACKAAADLPAEPIQAIGDEAIAIAQGKG